MNQPLKHNHPEWTMELHKRFGNWVIDITLSQYKNAIQEVHTETNYQRAVGVYWFLLDNQMMATKMAERLILQRLGPQ